jgi:alkanesulfonate monooxygenase SsuD/methylene tetrahydromethanopterin reductase-like flavin-dependent oxidoreductase (luciferase family)
LRLVAQYADAANLGAASWAGGVFTPEDAERKFAVLQVHCAAVGRPDETVLRTALVRLILAETEPAAVAKLARLPPPLRAFFEQLNLVGTPEAVVPRLRPLVAAGFQYLFLGIGVEDHETLQLTATRVIPAVLAG